jgi:hypothetical protein
VDADPIREAKKTCGSGGSGTLEKRYLLIMELPGLELLALDAGLQLQALPRTCGAILAVPVQRVKEIRYLFGNHIEHLCKLRVSHHIEH